MRTNELNVVAFDIGGTQGRCGRARVPLNENGGASDNARFAFSPLKTLKRSSGEAGSAWFARLVENAKELSAEPTQCAAISFGGPVSSDGSIQSMHVPGWQNVDVVGGIARAFGLPRERVAIENDANAGALGESRFGAGRGCLDMLFFTVSTGVGGGVILGGKLRRGAHGMAGEFGHMILDGAADAPQYAAGKSGALEALASGPAIEREGRAALVAAGLSVPEIMNAKTVFDAALAGEKWALATREKCVANLARGVAAAICAYDVERVVIGGGVALAGDTFFDPLREEVDRYLPSFMSGKVAILPASLGDQAPMYGAVAACLDMLP